ncbi:acyltransferase family protein [Sphingobium ummariense]
MENRGRSTADDGQGFQWSPAAGRLDWIDVARGIGIVAVVAGHVWTRGPLRDAIYSFHMPLFFLLSGMLAQPRPVLAFARRQVAGQMRPYAAFLALLIAADQIIEPLRGNRPIFHQWPDDLLPILLGGTWLRGPYTIFWFVPCLMVARILFNAVQARCPDPLDRRWGAVMIAMLALAYALSPWARHVSVLGSLSVPMAFCLLWAGAAWSRISWCGWMWGPILLLSGAGLAGLLPTLNMKAGDYGWPLLSIGAAVATSLLLCRISARIAPATRILAALGQASLVVMYLHVAFVHYLRPHMAAWLLLPVALIIPFGIDRLIRWSAVLRRIFL